MTYEKLNISHIISYLILSKKITFSVTLTKELRKTAKYMKSSHSLLKLRQTIVIDNS